VGPSQAIIAGTCCACLNKIMKNKHIRNNHQLDI
jgi:hypothetical protein